MVPIQIMNKGKWFDAPGLGYVRRGHVFRVKTGSHEWSEPILAHSNAQQVKHPKTGFHVWKVDKLLEKPQFGDCLEQI